LRRISPLLGLRLKPDRKDTLAAGEKGLGTLLASFVESAAD